MDNSILNLGKVKKTDELIKKNLKKRIDGWWWYGRVWGEQNAFNQQLFK